MPRMWQNLRPQPQEQSHDTPKGSQHCRQPPGENFPAWDRKSTQSLTLDNPKHSKKNAADIEDQISQGKITLVPAPEGDVIEIDEICIQVTPSFWVWIAVSRLVGQVLGFVFGDRTDSMLPILWNDVPRDYLDKPVYTDEWGAYGRFFPAWQHHPSKKGSGETNHSEGWNTKWRQRQSGLVRESCGVHAGIEEDLVERFLIMVRGHNQECQRRWLRQLMKTSTTG